MRNVVLLIFSIICFLTQVGYSIYYSINIVDISTQANQIQKKLEINQIELQLLKTKYLKQSSLTSLKDDPTTRELIPITRTIQLNQ